MPTATKSRPASRTKAGKQKEALRKLRASRERSENKSEIGEPPLTRSQRSKGTYLRNLCRKSLLKFNVLCFPNSTGLKPFGKVQLDSIKHDEDIIRNGGRVVKLEPRGFAKTSRACNAALKAILYNERKMVPIFSANMDKSKNQVMARWKVELASNDLLYWMFPYLLWPFRALGNKPQGARSQTYRGKPTHIQWLMDRIVLPTIEGEKSSGNILIALPLESARGATHTLQDGTILRPDLCIFDDVQKDEDADNPNTVKKLEDVIDHTAMMLGGHAKTMSAIFNATVRKAEDLPETYYKKQGWRHVRYKMLEQPAIREKELWLGQYADLRRNYDPESPTDQRRAQKESLQFYIDHRKEMDEGAVVTWEWAYAWDDDDPIEISAIQHAYNILIDLGEDVFASECQNEPIRDHGGLTILKPSEMCEKQSGYPRKQFPRECSVLTAFVDVHEQIHYWQVWAWEPNFTGYLIDYGTFPDQRRRHFRHDMLAVRLDRFFPGMDAPATITAGLEALIHGHKDLQFTGLLHRDWIRGDGVVMRISKCGVDANGEHSDAIKKFIRQRQVGAVMYPSYGRGVKATEIAMSRWTQAKGKGTGPEWVDTKGQVGDPAGIMFDTNFWKTQAHRKLALPTGSQGATYFFKTGPEEHKLVADHYFAERPKEVSCGSRIVYEFPSKFKGDNHYWDCYVGNQVAASKAGIRSVAGPPPKKAINMAELQRQRWAREGRA